MPQRVLVLGSGGREHALCWKLAQSPSVSDLFWAPGNAGAAGLAEVVAVRPTDLDAVVSAAQQRHIDLVVSGTEEPLAEGLIDRLDAADIAAFGPTRAAARIESSKAFAKEIMAAAGVPTARSVLVRDVSEGIATLSRFALPVVLKADGLAAGKGVVICATRDEAIHALTAMLDDGVLGAAGRSVLIEEHLTGPELSILSITDGETVYSLPPARDHKRAFDGDRGPNTGGMGVYTPVPDVDEALMRRIEGEIIRPTIREMARRGAPFRGTLFTGLMLTADGPKVLEFNCRFGDPETQVVLPLMEGDLAELLTAVSTGTLNRVPPPTVRNGAAVGVVLASGGYPGPYATGRPISGLDPDDAIEDTIVFHAGTRRDDSGAVVTAGGRVLTVVGLGPDLATARDLAYARAGTISFDRAWMRTDIAATIPG